MTQFISTGLLLCISWIISSSSHLRLQVIFIIGSRSSLDLDHHGTSSLDLDHLSIWINITGLDLDHHLIWIITAGSSSLDLDHHWILIITQSRSSMAIITGSQSSLDMDHHWCYLMILLVTGSYTDPTLFHAGCRPTHHVGIRLALTSDLLVKKARPALTYDHVGTNPIIISERPSTHIHQHDRTSYH